MSALPFPVRVAAGLVVAAVEEAQALPRTVAGLPITAVSHVLQMSMRAQQVVTELAIKGDYALDGMRPVEEAPSWARFDEDGDDHLDAILRPLAQGPAIGRPGSAWDSIGEDEVVLATVDEDRQSVNGHSPLADELGEGDDGSERGGQAASPSPDALPGYETMSIAQLRGRLRSLTLEQVTELLAWESAHADRPPFVTMLSNRITTLTAEG